MECFVDDREHPSVYALFCDETELKLFICGLERRGYKDPWEASIVSHSIVSQMLQELRRVQEFPALLRKQAD